MFVQISLKKRLIRAYIAMYTESSTYKKNYNHLAIFNTCSHAFDSRLSKIVDSAAGLKELAFSHTLLVCLANGFPHCPLLGVGEPNWRPRLHS